MEEQQQSKGKEEQARSRKVRRLRVDPGAPKINPISTKRMTPAQKMAALKSTRCGQVHYILMPGGKEAIAVRCRRKVPDWKSKWRRCAQCRPAEYLKSKNPRVNQKPYMTNSIDSNNNNLSLWWINPYKAFCPICAGGLHPGNGKTNRISEGQNRGVIRPHGECDHHILENRVPRNSDEVYTSLESIPSSDVELMKRIMGRQELQYNKVPKDEQTEEAVMEAGENQFDVFKTNFNKDAVNWSQ